MRCLGISTDLENTLAKATTFTGTLQYMAPERISGGQYSYPSDIWYNRIYPDNTAHSYPDHRLLYLYPENTSPLYPDHVDSEITRYAVSIDRYLHVHRSIDR